MLKSWNEELSFGYYKVDCPFCCAPAGKRCQREVKHATHEHSRIEAQAVPHVERVTAWKEYVDQDYDPEFRMTESMVISMNNLSNYGRSLL